MGIVSNVTVDVLTFFLPVQLSCHRCQLCFTTSFLSTRCVYYINNNAHDMLYFVGKVKIWIHLVIVADEAFGLSTCLLKPYIRHKLDSQKHIFNYRLSTAQWMVECILFYFTKWPILLSSMQLDMKNAANAMLASYIVRTFLCRKKILSHDL